MKIGELAEWARCPAVTIRYYEKIGLISGEKRDYLNHRIYDEEDKARLRLILHCRNHGISMPDIRNLLELRNDSGNAGSQAVHIIRKQIENLKSQRKSLDQLIASLSRLLDATDANEPHGRDIIEALESPCPHCTDYEEGARACDGSDRRAACLANPAIRKRHDIF